MAYGIDIRFEDDALRTIAEMAASEKTGARGLISAVEKVLLKFEKKLPSTTIDNLVVTRAMAEHPARELKGLLAGKGLDAMYARHRQIIETEKDALRECILEKINSLSAARQSFLSSERLDILLNTAVVKCRPYQNVLDEAMAVEGAVKIFEKKFSGLHGIEIQFDEQAVNILLQRVLADDGKVDLLLEKLLKNYEHGLKLIREKTGKNRFVFSRRAVEAPQQYLSDLIKESYQQGA